MAKKQHYTLAGFLYQLGLRAPLLIKHADGSTFAPRCFMAHGNVWFF